MASAHLFQSTIAGSLPKPFWLAEPEKLWATIVTASLVGILFFAAVSLVERWVMRRRPVSE